MGCSPSVAVSPGSSSSSVDGKTDLQVSNSTSSYHNNEEESPKRVNFQSSEPESSSLVTESQKEERFFAMVDKVIEEGDDYKPDKAAEEKERREMTKRIERLSMRGTAPDAKLVMAATSPRKPPDDDPDERSDDDTDNENERDSTNSNECSGQKSFDVDMDRALGEDLDGMIDNVENVEKRIEDD